MKIVECYSIYSVVVTENDINYTDIRLRDTAHNRSIVKTVIRKTDGPIIAGYINNKSHLSIETPDGEIYVSPIHSIRPANKETIREIKRKDRHEREVKKLHSLLKELGLSFHIQFHHYREDADYMTIKYKGEEIFSGITDDLNHDQSD